MIDPINPFLTSFSSAFFMKGKLYIFSARVQHDVIVFSIYLGSTVHFSRVLDLILSVLSPHCIHEFIIKISTSHCNAGSMPTFFAQVIFISKTTGVVMQQSKSVAV